MKKLVNDANFVYALVVCQENAKINELLPNVQPFLDEFSNVIPEEISYGLSLISDIQYCINFILDVMLPNKAAYQMSPIEHAEL